MKQYNFKKEYDENGHESVALENKRKIRLDLIPRLLCVVLALIIWIYCVNVNDIDVVTTFNVKLDVVGNMRDGMQIYSTSNISEVTITVQGTNRDINKYSASDYSATIDVSQITSAGWSTLKITTNKPKGAENSTLSILSANIPEVSVYTDINTTASVPIEIKKGGITQPLNYQLDYNFENEVDKIGISGPKTLIDQISKAEYLLEGTFDKSTLISGFALNFYNQNGETISNDGEISAGFISYDTSDMVVNVIVSAPVPLKIKAEGTNPDYAFSVAPVTATVVGDPNMLNSVSDYVIDMDEYFEEGTFEYSITIPAEALGYPEGVQLKEESVTVKVTAVKQMPLNTPAES